jgi:hypothetical protein
VASTPNPAESVSMPGHELKTCSAVGLRNRFCEQMKRALRGKIAKR